MINSVKPIVYVNRKLVSNNVVSKVITAIILFFSGASKIQLNSEEKFLCKQIIDDIQNVMTSGGMVQNNRYRVERVSHGATGNNSIYITYIHEGKQCRESVISYSDTYIIDTLLRLSELEERFASNERPWFPERRPEFFLDDYDAEYEGFEQFYNNDVNDAPSEKTLQESRKFQQMMLDRNLLDESSGSLNDFAGGIANVKFEDNVITHDSCPNFDMLEDNPESLRVTLHCAGDKIIANCFGEGSRYDEWGRKKFTDPVTIKKLEYVYDVTEFTGIVSYILNDSSTMIVLSGYDALRFLNEQAKSVAPVVRKHILPKKSIDNFEDQLIEEFIEKFMQEFTSNLKEMLVNKYDEDVDYDIALIVNNLSENFYASLRTLAINSKSHQFDELPSDQTPYAYAERIMQPERGFNFLSEEILASIQERHDSKTNIPKWLKNAIDQAKENLQQYLIDDIDDAKKDINQDNPGYASIEEKYNEINDAIKNLVDVFDDVVDIPQDPDQKEQDGIIKTVLLDEIKRIEVNIENLSNTINNVMMKQARLKE